MLGPARVAEISLGGFGSPIGRKRTVVMMVSPIGARILDYPGKSRIASYVPHEPPARVA